MFGLMGFACLTVLFVEVNPQITDQVCVMELFSVIANPTVSVCGEYATCLVLSRKLLMGDLSMKDIADIEEPYQDELDSLGVDCDLNFTAVIEKLRGPISTTTSAAVPTTTTTLTTPTTITTTTTTVYTVPDSTTLSPLTTISSTTPSPTTRTITTITATTPVYTVPESTTLTSSTTISPTTASTTTITTMATTPTTSTPSTSTTNSTLATSTTRKYPSTPISTSVTPTATRKTTFPTLTTTMGPKITSLPRSTTSSTTTTDSGIPECIKDTDDGCVDRRDGDYPACFPVCQKGVYITCSGGRTAIRNCQFGWYTNPQSQRFLARIMFQPTTKRCEYRTAYCPRQLDAAV